MLLFLMAGTISGSKECKPITKDIPQLTPKIYRGAVREQIFTTKQYILERLGKTMIIDAGDPDVYSGITVEPWRPVPGHTYQRQKPSSPMAMDTRRGLQTP